MTDTTTTATKVCARCGLELPTAAFYTHPHTRDGLTSWCRECTTRRAMGMIPQPIVVEVDERSAPQLHPHWRWVEFFLRQAICSRCHRYRPPLYLMLAQTPLDPSTAARLTEEQLRILARNAPVLCRRCYEHHPTTQPSATSLDHREEMVAIADLLLSVALRRQPGPALTISGIQAHTKRELVRVLRQRTPCMVCGETDPVVLDLVSLNPQRSLRRMMRDDSVSLLTFLTALEEAALLCANCRLRHSAGKITVAPLRFEWKHTSL